MIIIITSMYLNVAVFKGECGSDSLYIKEILGRIEGSGGQDFLS